MYFALAAFARVALVRFWTLIGDYKSALTLATSPATPASSSESSQTLLELFGSQKLSTPDNMSLAVVHASLCYHAGFSALMLRQYSDAARLCSYPLAASQRAANRSRPSSLSMRTQQSSTLDRLNSLCTGVSAIAIASMSQLSDSDIRLDPAVNEAVKSEFSAEFDRMCKGSVLFSLSFLHPHLNFCSEIAAFDQTLRLVQPDILNLSRTASPVAVFDRHCKLFCQDLSARIRSANVARNLRLFASVPCQRLAALLGVDENGAIAALMAYRLQATQIRLVSDRRSAREQSAPVNFSIDNDFVIITPPQSTRRGADFVRMAVNLQE